MHFESTDSSAVVCELQSELVAQAVASLSTGFSAADGCTFFLENNSQCSKIFTAPPLLWIGHCRRAHWRGWLQLWLPTQVLKSNIPSPFGCCCRWCCHCCCCCCCCCCCHCCCCCCFCCCCCRLQCLRHSGDNDAIGGREHPFRFTIETNVCFASVDFHCFRDLPFQRFSECLGYSELKS